MPETGMNGKSSRGVICLSLVVGFFLAAPSSRRPPLNPSLSPLLVRAEERDDFDLKPDEENVCSGIPDYAKGVIPDSSPLIEAHPADGAGFGKDRGQAVLSLIRYPWQELGYNIVFMGSRAGYRAMTLTVRRRIEVYVRPGEGVLHQAFDLAHELGHAFDLKYNTGERRKRWYELRGIKTSTPWFGCDACPDYGTPAGDFAETFAYLLLGPGNFHSQIAPIPRPEQVEELAAFCNIEHISETLAANPPRRTGPGTAQSARAATREKAIAGQNSSEEALEAGKKPAVIEDQTAALSENPQEDRSTDAPAGIQAPRAEDPSGSRSSFKIQAAQNVTAQ